MNAMLSAFPPLKETSNTNVNEGSPSRRVVSLCSLQSLYFEIINIEVILSHVSCGMMYIVGEDYL